ncbi:Type IV secretory pathway, VirB4 component [Eubacterium oxidoreducens]|uniref:Type IV secretory pathway, VirB4 component n=2 Tax=Eubacterium oxidoreducens TaxID=1732 RepID=A0A1G6C3P9_EUBOX|nr:Type IV secretory pathway, VirB4 component [Eubacterium oxidoreducens]
MTPLERISAIKEQRAMQKEQEIEIDVTQKDHDIFIQSPLPTTLAVDLIPIEKIERGIVYTEDNRRVKILEILPINFLLKSDEEQESVVEDFAKWLKIAPSGIQIKSLSKRADVSSYIDKMRKEIANEKDEKCKELMIDQLNLITQVSATESVSRRFFIVLEKKIAMGQMISDEEIENELNIAANRAKTYLASCGNKMVTLGLTTQETAKIYFDILNRTKNAEVDFEQQYQDVHYFYECTYGEESLNHIPVTEFISPSEIDLTHRDYTRIDDTYYSFVYIKQNHIPNYMPKGWLSILTNAGVGIDVDLFLKKEDKRKSLDRIGRHMRWNMSKMNDISASNSAYDDTLDTLDAGNYLKQGLSGGGQDLYYFAILLTITSNNLSTLRAKKREFLDYLRSIEIDCGNTDYEQKRALTSYIPLGQMDKKIFARAKRNVLTSDLACFYPFTNYEMFDEDGIFLGINEMNNSICATDIFDSKNYMNANISILGTSGAGKTYLLQLLAQRFRKKGIQTFIIAPDKGHEFARACQAIGGEFAQISPASEHCINVLDIRKPNDTASKALDGDYYESSLLSDKINGTIETFFSLLIPDMDGLEEELLDEAILRAYERKGITMDNTSLYKEDGSMKEMPILSDVYEELLKDDRTYRLAMILKKLVNGSAKSFNGQTNVDLNNLYTVIDISKLTGKMLTIGMFVALDAVRGISKEDRTKKKAIILDEAWELIGAKSNKKAAEYTLEIFKIIRGYGGSAICATQNLTDFFSLDGGAFGEGIINNSKTKILLKLENRDAKAVQELLDLSDEEYKKIIKFERGHGLLATNGNNVPIHFLGSPKENDLITTDRKQLEQLAKEKEYGNATGN